MATITITTQASHDARIAEAYGNFLGLGRNATVAEIKAELVAHAKSVVKNYERNTAINSAVTGITLVTIT